MNKVQFPIGKHKKYTAIMCNDNTQVNIIVLGFHKLSSKNYLVCRIKVTKENGMSFIQDVNNKMCPILNKYGLHTEEPWYKEIKEIKLK